jgi:sugar phosphate isomerase/epimerase
MSQDEIYSMEKEDLVVFNEVESLVKFYEDWKRNPIYYNGCCPFKEKIHEEEDILEDLNLCKAYKLLDRINNIKLYAHRYAFTANFSHSDFGITDLINFAVENNLAGVEIHVNYGNRESRLSNLSQQRLQEVAKYAGEKEIDIRLEASNTEKETIDELMRIASIMEVKSVRVYVRKKGFVNINIIPEAIGELKYAAKKAKELGIEVVLEQHEDLKSSEFVKIVKKVNQGLNTPHLFMVYDFGNMVNAFESPLGAFAQMKKWIRQAHIKDIKIVPVKCPQTGKKGYAQVGVKSGEGDVPMLTLIYQLLLLDKKDGSPQVYIFDLEEVNHFVSITYRFDQEDKDVHIPFRSPSNTLVKGDLKNFLKNERRDARDQVHYVGQLLSRLEFFAKQFLDSESEN